MHRVVLFLGGINQIASVMVPALLDQIRQRPDLELAAICLSREPEFLKFRRRHLKKRIRSRLRQLAGSSIQPDYSWAAPINPAAIRREFGARILVPPKGNPNAPEFVELLRSQVKPTLGFCFYFIRRFQPALLDSFHTIVNYHNGLLPAYRGLRATAWSIYNREPGSGFTFHHMNREMDQGPVLLSGAVPIFPGESKSALDYRKAELAATMMPSLVEKVMAGEQGKPQGEGAAYYSIARCRDIVEVNDPGKYSREELEHRLAAFGEIWITLDNRRYRVSQFQHGEKGKSFKSHPTFRDLEGRTVTLRNYSQEVDSKR